MAPTSTDDKYLVPALQRGLDLLSQFSRECPELSGAELSKRLGLPRASVFRILYTLERSGFVERIGESANYRLGMGVLRLGFEYLASMDLTELGTPIIEELRDATSYSSHLVVRDGRHVVFVAKAPSRSALFHSIQVGARLPAHATVLGRLLLSGLDLDALFQLYPDSPLPSYTPRTPTTVQQLKALIDEDKAKGYAISQGGYETGISTIAAPVHNGRGEVVAVINITVPTQSVSEEQKADLIPKVKQAAAQLSQRISLRLQRKT